MNGVSISIEAAPDDATVSAISDGLNAYNAAASGSATPPETLWLVARHTDGGVVGGIRARIARGWIEVEWLWVAEAHRGGGLGTSLLARAEAEGEARGCRGAFLWTYSFQAPGFYGKQGYTEFGRLPDMPPGHARIYLAKRFSAAGPQNTS